MPAKTQDIVARVLARCDQLAQFSELEDGVLRQYLTPEHRAANQQVAQWLNDAGLMSWQDSVGNQWGRLPAAKENVPRLILGSHLDTVPFAGKYDGILGVLLAVELLSYFSDQAPLPFHLDVVGFADEEGTRFGTTLIGSKALAGQFASHWLQLTDRSGTTMADALQEFGLSADQTSAATLNARDILAYWEVHIEQGPVLEALQQPLGVVSGIAGAKRAHIRIQGQAGHAGTTPMHMRQDALAGAAELIQFIETSARGGQHQEVATVGNVNVKPGAANVIAGACTLTLDVRALNDADRDALVLRIEAFAQQMAAQRQLNCEFDWYHEAPAVLCNNHIQQQFHQAARNAGLQIPTLPSGAGHDAMAVASVAPVGMLFLRSPGGISHHPDERVIADDIGLAFNVMKEALMLQALK
ncbi:allantoate amidohydrolase [Reinekea sp. G2M2-21]|uniref:allantoate amidohydrolase n=1 Tax=Reinekea sp. G2M2-21 TaxID=2788942 RepID=UPI0018ABD05D|nr:allantoate amidohydrolase [Reinekea sp. G2M2-21]